MPATTSRLSPLRILAIRALVGYPLLRVLLLVVAALVGEFAGAGAYESLQSSLGVILVAAAVGAADIRRRGESLLWANLGYPAYTAPAFFAAAAIVGEVLLAWILA